MSTRTVTTEDVGNFYSLEAEYLDRWTTRRLLPALGMIPVERTSPRQAYGALRVAAGVLEADELFAVYPEGT